MDKSEIVRSLDREMIKVCDDYWDDVKDDVYRLSKCIRFASAPKKWWPYIKILGPVGFANLVYHYGGSCFYPPSVKMLNVYARHAKIYGESDYMSDITLGRRYDMTRKQVWNVVRNIDDRLGRGVEKLCRELEEL